MMQRRRFLGPLVASITVLVTVSAASAQNPSTCLSENGSPTVCFVFDDLGFPQNAPERTFDFTIDFSDPANPDIELRTGTDATTTRQWRIWSTDPGGGPGDIGDLTANAAFDYDVTVRTPDSLAGAGNLGTLDLRPLGTDKASAASIVLSGTVSGNVTLQERSNGTGGQLHLELAGDMGTDINVPVITLLSVGGDLTGNVTCPDVSSLTVDGDVTGNITIAGDVNSGLSVGGNVSGRIEWSGFTSAFGLFIIIGEIAPTGVVQINGDLSGVVMVPVLGVNGLLRVDGDVLVHSFFDIEGLLIGGTSSGTVSIGGNVPADVTLTGSFATGSKFEAGGVISGDFDSQATFDGSLCDATLTPGAVDSNQLGPNFIINAFGPNAVFCGDDLCLQNVCPVATITLGDPVDGVVDARYPHTPNDANAYLGIDSVEVTLDTTTSGDDPSCWALCETDEYANDPNGILGVTLLSTGVDTTTYRLDLERPLTAGAATTINYINSPKMLTYITHPANVNGNSAAGPGDILSIIDCLNGIDPLVNCPFGVYSADTDHSGAADPPDILAVIDLLNGASQFQVWNGTTRPENTTCTEVCAAFGGASAQSSGGSGLALLSSAGATIGNANSNAALADGFVSFLTTTVIHSMTDRVTADVAVGALTQWSVDHFSLDERRTLVDRLDDEKQDFADWRMREYVQSIIAELTD